VLARYLGAPLPEVFSALGLPEDKIAAAIAAYRADYAARGIFMNALYPGVAEMLAAVGARGAKAFIVTSKQQGFAETVARNLGIGGYFAGIVGAGPGDKDTKTTLVAAALALAGTAAAETVMLGDRNYDVTGALQNGVTPVGALWGYGTRDELERAGCRDFADTVAEFQMRFFDPPAS
jgi:phosphoglycolate phosphatase